MKVSKSNSVSAQRCQGLNWSARLRVQEEIRRRRKMEEERKDTHTRMHTRSHTHKQQTKQKTKEEEASMINEHTSLSFLIYEQYSQTIPFCHTDSPQYQTQTFQFLLLFFQQKRSTHLTTDFAFNTRYCQSCKLNVDHSNSTPAHTISHSLCPSPSHEHPLSPSL